jgi:hypothetical protein
MPPATMLRTVPAAAAGRPEPTGQADPTIP